MLGAYGWAYVKPVRKLYYNITVTTISVIVALLIATVEALGLIADRLHPGGAFWDGIASLNDNFGMIGYLIVGVFVLCWLLSAAVYRWKRFGELDVRSEPF
jgi:high-affinity nickel-transport protein